MDGDAGRERDVEDNDSPRSMAGFNGDMGDAERDGPSSLLNTSAYSMYDVNQLRIQNKQLKLDLQSEQDMVSQLRKRLNTAEKQRLEGTSQHNKEIGSLENQLAKLRSQIEKGEATRHNIEFELTKAQREITQQKQQQSQREASLQENVDELRQKVADLTDELKRAEHQLRNTTDAASEQERKLRSEVAERDHEAARFQAEMEVCRNERDRLAAISKQQESTIGEFGEKVQIFESEHKNQSDDLRRAVSEIKFCKEREDRLKKDLEGAALKIKSLEETVEAERAAHLETKFNSEIVQLRVRDLEGGLEVEKSANSEANRAVERLTKQIRELEQMYDEERKIKKDVLSKLDKTEKEYLSTRRQLSGEVEEKKTVIGSLSKELEVHQKNFNELKTELAKAKKRQAYLEDTYGTAFKELEFLLMNYDTGTEDKGKKLRLTAKKEEVKTKKTQTPAAVVENLKQSLMTYRRKLDATSEELSKSKKNCEKQARELESCRDMIKSKDKSLEDAHKNYTRTAKELNKARASYGELEGMVGKLRSSLETTASSQGKDRNRIQELSEEIMKLVKRQKQENEEKQAFLHGLYQRLLAGRVLVAQQDRPLSQLSWGDLTHMVYEQVGSTVDALNRAEEKLKNLTDNLKSRDEVVAELQKQHEEQLSRLTQLSKDRESAWNKQKEEMEQHYAQLLSDLQSRTKKSQAMADQAWEKMRATGSVQQGLEAECLALRQQLTEAETRSRTLLTACALLCGAVYPMYARFNALSVQRHILEDQMTVWDNCRERARYLVNVLNTELTQSPDTPERDRRPGQQRNRLLQFRVGAITVMAAHRLIRLGRQCCRCFVSYDSVAAGNGILVCTGGLKLAPGGAGVANVGPDGDQSALDDSEMTLPPTSGAPQGQTQLLGWLTSSSLADTVAACMADVTDAAHRIKDEGEAVEHRALVSAAKSSFSKLMDHMGQFFPSVGLHPVASTRDRRSLAGRLGRTLARRLQGKNIMEKDFVASSQDLLIALQNHILDFTQRLHTVEVERRQLLKELGGLKAQIAGLGSIPQGPAAPSGLQQSVKLVTMDKFERVCEELNEALQREQTAQQILQEQSRQLQELTARLDLSDTQGVQNQQTLSEAMTGLNEVKEDLRRKDQELKQCRKQAMQFEFQRKSLQANLKDAEDALRTAAKDKEILAHYIKSVEGALEEAKKKLVFAKDGSNRNNGSGADSTITLSKLLLNADLIPSDIGKAGPELIACQNLVGAFVDLHHQSLARVRVLEEETASLQQHVSSLKRELSDAVHREFSEQDLPTRDEYDLTPSVSQTDISGREEFKPLREDSEISVSMTSVSGTVEKSSSKSAFKAVRSSGLQTPKMSSHKSRPRHPVSGHR
ncbi:coiled-coil domain-containing protein 171-like isoform X2 [Babylonia areolata]|uniref:coiled-coil domain-containing protein 171-like isoform X2 n=1 Tax=Babylonia areolata TaxID=304850 RepID=UPI003FD24686